MNTSWTEINTTLVREFTFPSFEDAIAFINRVALIATELNHHPDIHNIYDTVTLTLSTHDAGDTVTDKDRELARRIDTLL